MLGNICFPSSHLLLKSLYTVWRRSILHFFFHSLFFFFNLSTVSQNDVKCIEKSSLFRFKFFECTLHSSLGLYYIFLCDYITLFSGSMSYISLSISCSSLGLNHTHLWVYKYIRRVSASSRTSHSSLGLYHTDFWIYITMFSWLSLYIVHLRIVWLIISLCALEFLTADVW